MQIVLANPRGFCAGVDRAIDIVDQALETFGAPIYVRHEVVHNRTVVDGLKEKGAIFIEDISDVPVGTIPYFQRPRRIKASAKRSRRAQTDCL